MLATDGNNVLSISMKGTHRSVLEAIFATPTRSGIVFSDIEAFVIALGGDVREGAGSRIVFEMKGSRRYLHRPHPGKEAKKYQVEDLREWLRQLEVKP
jgi:hypothetical protein